MKQLMTLGSILLLFALLWTVSAQEAEETQSAEDHAALVERGREVFVSLACTACHGQNAEGTDLAPALAGHSDFAIRRQVRAPVGIMPPYSPVTLSAEDLDAVVAYIQSLVPAEATEGHEHGHAELPAGDISFAHHWLLWLALEAEDTEAAIHQIGHLLPYLTAPHLTTMENIMDFVTAGDFEAARTLAEPMVIDVNVFGEDGDFVYLQMIYRAIVAEDAEASSHFIIDYLEHMENHNLMGLIGDVQAAVDSSDFEAAAALLEAEFGDSLLFENVTHDDEYGEEAGEESHEGHGEATEAPTDEHSGH